MRCCAVYTRKSSEEGLEHQFNSLDAQRDAGKAYVKSHCSWSCKYAPDLNLRPHVTGMPSTGEFLESSYRDYRL